MWSVNKLADPPYKCLLSFTLLVCITLTYFTKSISWLLRVQPTKGGFDKLFWNRRCHSRVGRSPHTREQTISIGHNCEDSIGVPLHEILHALGFFHEQSRRDRDDYIEIIWNNIQKGKYYIML